MNDEVIMTTIDNMVYDISKNIKPTNDNVQMFIVALLLTLDAACGMVEASPDYTKTEVRDIILCEWIKEEIFKYPYLEFYKGVFGE